MKINFKNNFDTKLIFLKLLFYGFPLFMFTRSAYINAYIFIIIIFSLFFFFKEKIRIKFSTLDYLILLFFISSILSTLLNIQEIKNFNIGGKEINFEISTLTKSFFNLRFLILYIIIKNIIDKKFVDIKFFSKISLTCSFFLVFNIILQHIIGYDLFGNPPFDYRYNGFFEHEAIAGSYLQKFFLISILSIFLLDAKHDKKFTLIFISINIIGLGILLSFDRMPYLVFVLSIFLLLLILKNFRSLLLLNLLSIIFIFIFFFYNYSQLKERYLGLSRQLDLSIVKNLFHFGSSDLTTVTTGNVNLQSDYLKNYIIAYKVILKNPIMGSGLKSFSFECEKLEIFNKRVNCMTHPHNIYLEILVNQGIIGISIFFIFIFILIKKNYLIFFSSKILMQDKLLSFFIFTILVIELIPLRSYGSIFSTINGSIFWFFLALISINSSLNKSPNK